MSFPGFSDTQNALGQFQGISLAQLQEEAAFLTRIDRKYIVPGIDLAELLDSAEPGTRALEIDGRRSFGYSTRYFDAGHVSYYRALRKRRDRFKVRTRLYDGTEDCLLEVKLADGRGRTVKHRFQHDADHFETLSSLDRAWLQSFQAVRSAAVSLDRSVATHYWRSTLVFPGGSGRMTIDQELTFIGLDGNWLRVDGLCIIEIKSPGRALPFDRLLWARGFRPTPASKFALGVCLIDPELPDNRWHRLRSVLAGSLVAGDRTTSPISLPGVELPAA